jgi:hypothetical protein
MSESKVTSAQALPVRRKPAVESDGDTRVAGSTKNRLAGDTEMSGLSKDGRGVLLRAFRKLMPQKRGENENVGSSGKTKRRHQAENPSLASFRDGKSISGSKV